jgi:hypothetical protein
MEPNAQPTLCNLFMTSHETMSPQIKHDIGLGLLVKEQSKSYNDRTKKLWVGEKTKIINYLFHNARAMFL